MYLASFDSDSVVEAGSGGGLKIKYKIDTPTSMAMTEKEYESSKMTITGFSDDLRRHEVDQLLIQSNQDIS